MSNSPSVSLPVLAPDRVHEASGPAALAFALLQAAQLREGKGTDKAVLLIVPTHLRGGLLPSGVAPLIDPSRLITVQAPTQTDQLWSMEEALRSGAVHAVITLTEKPLTLTQGRRLQLAAESGRTLGLLVTGQEGGSNTSETRWHCVPLWDEADSTLQAWSLKKNKRGTSGNWTVRLNDKSSGPAGVVHLVSQTGERPHPAAAAS
ncbi:ImuA family protein [Pannonibacter phragmitetus]|uniref:Protein ImuA n=1 Tax=Pannonibacter phragmitetus TaxID=121719 RepID=A0A0U3P507_9HYPH|nr:hypothetical protein [Pannonibacter phragmitetus]ALV26901.1 hypothetical protein APZ00_07255 [Pannonibacter phragmitetus]